MDKQVIIDNLNQVQDYANKIYAELAKPDVNLNYIHHFSFRAGNRFNDIMNECLPDRAEKIVDIDEKDMKAVDEAKEGENK